MHKFQIIFVLTIILASCVDHSRWDFLNKIYFDYDRAMQYDSALIVGLESLQEAEKIFSFKDVRIATSLNNVAEMHRELNEYQNAIPFYKRAIDILNSNKQTTNIATVYSNLGVLYYDIEEDDSARFYFNRAIEIAPNNCEKALSAMRSLADMELRYKNFENAKSLLDRIKKCLKKEFNPDDIKYGKYFSTYGELFLLQREFDSAFYYFNKSKIIHEAYYKNHRSLSTIYNQIGTCYFATNQYDSAATYLLRSIDVRRTQYGKISKVSHRVVYNLGRLHQELGDSIKGNALIEKAKELRQELINNS